MPDEPNERWYYDACTLDSSLETVAEIINKFHPKQAYTSHLALGEALSNCYLKSVANDNMEILNAFINLLSKLTKYIKIVGNDGIEKIIKGVEELCPVRSITDKIHLATAIREKCNVFRTTDHDFVSCSQSQQKALGNAFGMSHFAIVMTALDPAALSHKKKKSFSRS